jgi:hypothetical protein
MCIECMLRVCAYIECIERVRACIECVSSVCRVCIKCVSSACASCSYVQTTPTPVCKLLCVLVTSAEPSSYRAAASITMCSV